MRSVSYAILLVCSLLGACKENIRKDPNRLFIVATTGMIADAVKEITGDSVEVYTLMGPGVDPHLYKPTPRDVDKLAEADIIVYNGLHLEGKMGEILEKISHQKKIIAVANGIPKSKLLITSDASANNGHITYDPHIWFDVNLWIHGCAYVGKELAKYDSKNAAYYTKNTETYLQQLRELNSWTRTTIETVPVERRVLVTAHDAFNYFGRAYNIEVMGLQGISTVAEPGLKDISTLVNMLVNRKIKAVFVESSVSEKSIHAVLNGAKAKDHNVIIGGTLFSDAMGQTGTPEGTYIGMVKHNVNTITSGLK